MVLCLVSSHPYTHAIVVIMDDRRAPSSINGWMDGLNCTKHELLGHSYEVQLELVEIEIDHPPRNYLHR